MPVTVYQSTDAGAPQLDGSAGSLCALLDAVLVNGYGSKAAAGWSIAFTATNKRVYRPPSGALRPYLRVDDTAPRAAPFNNGDEARLLGYEAMTTVDVGTGRYPATTTLLGIILQKSKGVGLNSPWVIIADDRTVYIFTKPGDYESAWAAFCFGEYYSLKTGGDNYNSIIIGSVTETIMASPVSALSYENLHRLSAVGTVTAGHYVPRAWNEIGPLTTTYAGIGKHGHSGHSAATLAGLLPFPNPWDDGVYLSQVWLHEAIGMPMIRGRMRGFWHFLHPIVALKHGDTWSGTGPLAGKTFMAIGPSGDFTGMYVMETSDTWETN